jgi:5-methyltetrahydropteroyltriglutamate--homocysteine methyltransferase
VTYHGEREALADCDRLRRELGETGSGRSAFMTAPSPGIIATTLLNAHYDSHERYLFTLAREMRTEYEIIHKAGFILQVDAPDLAMERTVFFQDNSRVTSFPLFLRGLGAARVVGDPSRGKPVKLV